MCAVRMPGTLRARFRDPGSLAVELGDWVVIPSIAGEDAGKIVVAPDQVVLDGVDRPLPPVSRLLTRDEMADVAAGIERARSLIDRAADALRSTTDGRFLCGLRLNLAGDALIAAYIGPPLDDPVPVQAALSDATGITVFVECESAARPEDAHLFGSLGRIPTATRDIETIFHEDFDLPETAPVFAPEGIPRLDSRVRTSHGDGRMVAMDVRHWRATVELDSGERVQMPPEDLSPPDPD
jgi:hypothetical protein